MQLMPTSVSRTCTTECHRSFMALSPARSIRVSMLSTYHSREGRKLQGGGEGWEWGAVRGTRRVSGVGQGNAVLASLELRCVS